MMNHGGPDYQHIIWPWKTQNWSKIKTVLSSRVNNFVDLDAKIASLRTTKSRPRLLHELFDLYYNGDEYLNNRVSQQVLFEKIIPGLQKLVLDAPRVFKDFNGRLLLPGQNTNITLTRLQSLTIIAYIWFGLFEYDYISPGDISIDEFSEPTFMYGIESSNVTVLQFILVYFDRVFDIIDTEEFNRGIIIIQRGNFRPPTWDNFNIPIVEPALGEGRTDDTYAPVQIAHAHQFIGGDLFKKSITQEELTLLIRPDCIPMLLFCARLDDNEAICVYGAEKFSQYTGIGSSIRYLQKYTDTTEKSNGSAIMMKNCVVFIDATQKSSSRDQAITDFERDLNKAYTGFSLYSAPCSAAVGNWSYDFNGANMQVKFIQLLLAASAARKRLEYHPIGREFESQLLPFIDWLIREKITISKLYRSYKYLIGGISSTSRYADLNIFESLAEMQ